jgi:hypothetical protein
MVCLSGHSGQTHQLKINYRRISKDVIIARDEFNTATETDEQDG